MKRLLISVLFFVGCDMRSNQHDVEAQKIASAESRVMEFSCGTQGVAYCSCQNGYDSDQRRRDEAMP